MQTTKLKKKGFTLVELVIVVAVIAVLSAILVPTIGCFVEDAKETSDMAKVKTFNTELARYEAEYDKPESVGEVLEIMTGLGYNVEKLTPLSTGDILWDSKNNRFMLVKDEEILYRDNTTVATEKVDLWKIIKKGDELSAIYSNYLNEGYKVSGTLQISTGLEVGSHTDVIAIKYENKSGEAKDVVIRTQGGTLTIDAPNDTVRHYGFADVVNVVSIHTASYHEYGIVKESTITTGHLVVESNGYIGALQAQSSASVNVAGQIDRYIGTALSEANVTGYVAHNGSDDAVSIGSISAVSFNINTAEDLYKFKYQVENYRDFSGVTVNLNADLECEDWEPIGTISMEWEGAAAAIPVENGTIVFNGIFNGNNHTVKVSQTNIDGDYGFFMAIGSYDSNKKAVVKNLTLDVDFESKDDTKSWVGGLADYMFGYVDITNVTVTGKIVSGRYASGFIGWCITLPNGKSAIGENVVFTSCVNKANISVILPSTSTSSDYAILGGIVAQVGANGDGEYAYTFTNCRNEGSLTASVNNSTSTPEFIIGGIVGQLQNYGTTTITNCEKGSAYNYYGKKLTGDSQFIIDSQIAE